MDDYSNDIDKYLKGQLTPAQMNALEKKALNDPFLADALQGLDSLPSGELQADILDLQGGITRRTQKGGASWIWAGRIAAALLLVAASTFLIIFISERQDKNTGNLALNTEEKSGQEQQVQPIAPTIVDSAGPGRSALPEASEQKEEEKAEQVQAPKPSADSRNRVQQLVEKAPTEDRIAESDVIDEEVGEKEAVDTEITEALRERERTASGIRPQSVPSQIPLEDATKVESARKTDDAAVAKRKALTGARAEGSAASYNVGRNIVRGKITFSNDGTGLPGVNVLVKGSNEGTVSDSQGNYQIAVEGHPTLQFSFIGFTTEEVEATSDEVDVKLNTDVSELSEVVVVGGTDVGFLPSTPTIMELAAPEGGRRMFKQYLEQNLLYPQAALENKIEGKVTIQFNIDMAGQLSNFRVIRGIGFGCEEEVIRLIRQGPKWSPTKKNESPIKDRVRLRMRFSLPKK